MAVWWMWVDIDSMLSSISAFQMDLERIQTPHSLFWDSWAEKTFYNLLFTDIQAAEIKFESNLASLRNFEPLPVIWKSLLKAIPEANQRVWLQNGQALGAALRHSGTALAGLTG